MRPSAAHCVSVRPRSFQLRFVNHVGAAVHPRPQLLLQVSLCVRLHRFILPRVLFQNVTVSFPECPMTQETDSTQLATMEDAGKNKRPLPSFVFPPTLQSALLFQHLR